ncbi:MAG: hypothetical protein ACYTFQ_24310, partial [Planctomycetota bacterium]
MGRDTRNYLNAQGRIYLPEDTKLHFTAEKLKPLPTWVLSSCLVDLALVELNLYSADIDDQDLVHVAKLKSVEQLILSRNPITDAGLKHLATMPNLRELVLDEMRITDEGLKYLARRPMLRVLRLSKTQITD